MRRRHTARVADRSGAGITLFIPDEVVRDAFLSMTRKFEVEAGDEPGTIVIRAAQESFATGSMLMDPADMPERRAALSRRVLSV